MSHEAPTVKEKLQILLAEYNSLRSEINARLSNAFQIATIAAAAAVAWFLGPASQANAVDVRLPIIFVLVIAACIWLTFHNFYKAAIRVQELEKEINSRAKEKLLLWENERGGLAKAPWARWIILWILRLEKARRT